MSKTQHGLVFYPKSHRYKLDGTWCPGVTTILSNGLPKKALMYWSARTVAEYVADHEADVESLRRMGRGPMVAALKETPWHKRDTAAVRGTEVHALAERLVHGEEVEVPEHLAGYVTACVDFLDDWGLVPDLTERPCASRKWRHAGTFDFIGTVKDGRRLIGDWKTTASGIWPETTLQVNAYGHSEFYTDEDGSEHPIPAVDGAIGVHLREDGYSVHPLRYDEQVYNAFLHIGHVANTARQMKDGWVLDAAEPPTAKETA